MNIDIQETFLLVVGSELLPEEKDRPLAYQLKESIDGQGINDYQKAIVVSDRWYLDNEIFQICPSILIGGPGVNAATGKLYNEMAVLWTDQSDVFIQATNQERFALWGMNHRGTVDAIKRFIDDGHLDMMLKNHWKD